MVVSTLAFLYGYKYQFYQPFTNEHEFLCFSGNAHACASSGYQATFSPPMRPGNEAMLKGATVG